MAQIGNPVISQLVSMDLFNLPTAQACCPICKLEYVNPVVLPCHRDHQFCRACGVDWLNQPHSNSCPTCCAAFIASMNAADMNYHQQLQIALQISGLQLIRNPDIPTHVDTFEFEGLAPGMDFFASSLVADTATMATRYLASVVSSSDLGSHIIGRDSRWELVEGVGFIDADKLLVNVLTMARLIRGLAAVQKNSFTSDDSKDWHLIVRHVGQAISAHRGKKKHVKTFRRRLRRSIEFGKSTRGLDIFVEPWTRTCVDLLLDYVAFVMWKEARELGVEKTSRIVRKKVGKVARHGVEAMQECKFM